MTRVILVGNTTFCQITGIIHAGIGMILPLGIEWYYRYVNVRYV